MSLIVRYARNGEDKPRLGVLTDDNVRELAGVDLDALLSGSLAEMQQRIVASASSTLTARDAVRLLPPVANQEVWAAGVTYARSRDARLEESGGLDVYARVYASDRPELFFKSNGWRVRGPEDTVGVRRDSGWNVPEPELALVVNSHGEIAGYTIGNDMSSRDIEGDNPLYLPQAKVYDQCCALGPGIRPAWELNEAPTFDISLSVRRGNAVLTEGSISTSSMVRSFRELVDWLFAAMSFPAGAVLLTGTGIVPDSTVSITGGDDIVITASDIGSLRNTAVEVGSASEPSSSATLSAL
jgi:2-dehydro-3-deoxy-D-arabinonate dehydratase